jgi:hypothetical protein
MTARHHMDGLGRFVRDGCFVLRAAVVGLRGRVQGFAFIALRHVTLVSMRSCATLLPMSP